MDIKRQLEIIKRGAEEIISEEELLRKLDGSLKTRTPLVVKAGFDPSAPDIHLGHTVLLRKMRQFQDLGHKVVFLIGDFTGRIGDPSGRNETRPQLSQKDVRENAQTYKKQVFKILDRKRTKVVFNSQWFEKMEVSDILKLTAHSTVAQLLTRADFRQRYQQGRDISLLEFIYPLLQGYDSVKLEADIEIGGRDQKFNLLIARELQKDYGKEPQVIITMPLLEGTDGKEKMSKSLGNHIGIDEAPKEMFGKIMSISDEMMLKYYELLTDTDLTSLKTMHPMEAKKQLAYGVVRQYHGEAKAKGAGQHFEKTFQKQDPFTGMQPKDVKALTEESRLLSSVVCDTQALGIVKSKSEFRRLIDQGAISVNGQKVTDYQFKLVPDKEYCIKVGKTRFSKIIVR